MDLFTKRVIAVICSIPAGKVMSYAQVALVAGQPGSARQVARVLHSCSDKFHLPWHRVISSRWTVSLTHSDQQAKLTAEGVEFDVLGRVDPNRFLFCGPFP